jgi:hypothetical protein
LSISRHCRAAGANGEARQSIILRRKWMRGPILAIA